MISDQSDEGADETPTTVEAKRGALVSDEAAAAMIEAHETEADSDTDANVDGDDVDRPPEPICECCGIRQATKSGVTVVNGRAYPNSTVCGECFIPVEEITLPEDVDREAFLEMHSDGALDIERS